jgi:hypothetical protein
MQILFGRRIIYALWLSKWDEERIFSALRPQSEYNKANRDLLFISTMAISFKNDIPDEKDILAGSLLGCNLLDEEIDFLVGNYQLSGEIKQIKLNLSDLEVIYEVIDGFRQTFENVSVQAPKEIGSFLDKYFADKLITFTEVDKTLKVCAKCAKDRNVSAELRKGLSKKLINLQTPKVMALFERHF